MFRFVTVVIVTTFSLAAYSQTPRIIEGPISGMTKQWLLMKGERFEILNGHSKDINSTDTETTQCFIGQYRMPCVNMINSTAYRHGQVTIVGNQVRKILITKTRT